AHVALTGTGFSSTIGNDSVSFNGTAATVTSAGPTQLVVTVPSGATTGPVSVSVTGVGSAATSSDFTVGALPVAKITGLSTNVATSGTAVTISGHGFDANAAHDVVRFDGTIARIQAASPTSLQVVVPPATGSGAVSVTTPNGTTTGPDFFIPPSP